MKTPIYDFIKEYNEKNISRLHMPGHKGRTFLGPESMDITEIKGADELYYPEGIIAESEANATELFGTGVTCYSTEGSSHCIRSMINLALGLKKTEDRPLILAARNVHKAFIYAVAIADIDVKWIYSKENENSIAAGILDAENLREAINDCERKPFAVYLTSPNYLGGMADIEAISKVCKEFGLLLLVDNAHGAYLHFLDKSHPIDLGADICCDSAHKTLPVLTGGAYLHTRKGLTDRQTVKESMEMTGSTSPSYLIMASLDLCNRYLSDGYSERLAQLVSEHDDELYYPEATKILIDAARLGMTGHEMGEMLRTELVEPEFCDADYVVLMLSPETGREDIIRVKNAYRKAKSLDKPAREKTKIPNTRPKQAMTIRQAVLAPHEYIKVEQAEGRICGNPTVSCPPAVPIAVSGELITKEICDIFKLYGIDYISVVKLNA